MSMDWNDPLLTAYALGELEGDELRKMEAFVRENKEAREYVREIRNTANLLASELKAEPVPASVKPSIKPAAAWWNLNVLNPYFSLVAAGLAALVFLLPSLRERIFNQGTLTPPEVQNDLGQFKPEKQGVLPEAAVTTTLADNPTPVIADTAAMDESANTQAAPKEEQSVSPAAMIDAAAQPTALAKKMSADYGAHGTVVGKGNVAVGFAGRANVAEGLGHNTESYSHIQESEFVRVTDQPLSTFSTDVDTASYSVVRRYLNSGSLPPIDAVRIEEMINYFPYAYAPPKDDKPFAMAIEQVQAPWKLQHKLVRIGLKSKDIDLRNRPKSNLVFLVDVSGSMNDATKLPLLKASLRQMIDKFTDNDRVAIVVYAGSTGLALPSTSNKNEILTALEKMESGGSTNGGAGIELAYRIAQENFIEGGANRVILATDGDFNVGTTSEGDLIRLIEEKAKSKIFLTVLGFGSGNYKDAMMEKLADKGNGNYAYIDSLQEAKKALVEQIGGTLVTVAKDVKIQVEFNPKFASAYRLIGYENRRLNKEDFNDDSKDAGEIGAGHTVTALYEVVPVGVELPLPAVDPLKYAKAATQNPVAANESNELLTVKLRYKKPEGEKSQLMEVSVKNEDRSLAKGSPDLKFAAAVAEFGMLLRDSKWKGQSNFPSVVGLARQGTKNDPYRKEFLELVGKAERLKRRGR